MYVTYQIRLRLRSAEIRLVPLRDREDQLVGSVLVMLFWLLHSSGSSQRFAGTSLKLLPN